MPRATTNRGYSKPIGGDTPARISTAVGVPLDQIDADVQKAYEAAGVSDGRAVRRGSSNIATSEARTNTAYGLLTTPDRVQNVVLPRDGLIFLAYQATWRESVDGAARAAIFLGSNQARFAGSGNIGPSVSWGEAFIRSGSPNADVSLASNAIGLASLNGKSFNLDYAGDSTTGQAVGGGYGVSATSGFASMADALTGGSCAIFAAAGTYDVSVQFKASSGSVTVRGRKLWVWTLAF